jgi:undecaprenyl-diphosphatase
MDPVFSIIAGVIQGVTEWLPISSSGQNMIALINLLGLEELETAFSLAIYLHLGTLLAVLVKMRSEVKEVVMKLPEYREDRLVQFLGVSTLSSALVGFPVYWLLKENLGTGQVDFGFVTALIGFFLILTGLMLYLSRDRMGKKTFQRISFLDMLVVGVAQGFTILPGVSRSGTTIAVLLFRDFRQEDALKLSFLMSIPAVVGVVFLDILGEGLQGLDSAVLFLGILAAFVSGYLTIDILLRFARRSRFDIFCVAFGLVAVLSYLVIPAP